MAARTGPTRGGTIGLASQGQSLHWAAAEGGNQKHKTEADQQESPDPGNGLFGQPKALTGCGNRHDEDHETDGHPARHRDGHKAMRLQGAGEHDRQHAGVYQGHQPCGKGKDQIRAALMRPKAAGGHAQLSSVFAIWRREP